MTTPLDKIRVKVRRLTGKPSINQITDEEIDEYVRDFYANDFPRHLSLDALNCSYQFITQPNVAEYPLGKDSDHYFDFERPVYIGGSAVNWFQNTLEFFTIFSSNKQEFFSTLGNGTPGVYEKTIKPPLLQRHLSISTVDEEGNTHSCVDMPTNRTGGTFLNPNTKEVFNGTVNYLTGKISIVFTKNIPTTNKIYFAAVRYAPSKPTAILFNCNTFIFRPIPDKGYLVSIKAKKTPSSFNDFPSPFLTQWWQFLAYGAAKKIFEDAQDVNALQTLLPSFQEQELLALRRTIQQNRNQQVATIYNSPQNYGDLYL